MRVEPARMRVKSAQMRVEPTRSMATFTMPHRVLIWHAYRLQACACSLSLCEGLCIIL
jgi:hypothetical protein